ncbi:hypothetical protein KIN20_020222 [Parelaphostrongylus tenuis]|uniref:Uncharacterized protein n=1 Tax=Parelaphostrongylus tenuis TaxID=148309 RepID=A0AAD5MSK4_PARTN|nr:hypothetical protein KIN20_020222 [Parelaphostrongylus tenuis]
MEMNTLTNTSRFSISALNISLITIVTAFGCEVMPPNEINYEAMKCKETTVLTIPAMMTCSGTLHLLKRDSYYDKLRLYGE